jgi:hypothetical protein
MMVPLVMTPSCVYMVEDGFFFTPKMSRQNVACTQQHHKFHSPPSRRVSHLGRIRQLGITSPHNAQKRHVSDHARR